MRAMDYRQFEGLEQHGFDVTFTFTEGEDEWATQPLPDEVRFVILPTIGSKWQFIKSFPSHVKTLWEAMRSHDIALVTAPIFPTIPALLAARMARKPAVLLLLAPMSVWTLFRRPPISKIAPFVLNLEVVLSTEALVLSDHLARGLLPPLKRRVGVTAFSGLSEQDFVPIRKSAPVGPMELLCVTRLVRYKRVDVAIEAVVSLRNRGVEANLTVLGDGEDRQALERFSKELGVSHVVDFMGWVDDPVQLGDHYQRAFALVLPSEIEGFGSVALEAMAAGTPVVRTAPPEMAELLEPGTDVLIVPTQSGELFAEALARLHLDRDLYLRIARNGQQKALSFTREAWQTSFCERARRLTGQHARKLRRTRGKK